MPPQRIARHNFIRARIRMRYLVYPSYTRTIRIL